ncbi:MAG: hypothetical protein CL558_05230 [Alphaproteobacteria bacterium]|nr:hypothetical protein [Alphaproteobacteria bacterium]MAS45871.1 hypothetical protein [Alphaproteobacteria bacterium]MAX95947.1 hypothetical protein [Alphaproteobacteria bacterium]MBN52964.1 hypothetical protein [Alphaproteobacteria bacterium]OUT42734.1 MAG: hypothetical protein CBB62_09475 [Micavibrio sp. TMED2]
MSDNQRTNPNDDSRYAHDEAVKFKINSRRAKLFGLWAAEQLGYEGDEAAAYAKEVVAADMDEPGYEDILRKVQADFDAKGADVSDHRQRTKIEELWNVAEKQIMDESK